MSERDRPRRILVVHNRYQQRGGEDTVVDADVAALRERGHEVELFERSNDELARAGKLTTFRRAVWSRDAARDIAAVVREFRPDIAHVHNHSYALSASVYAALAEQGVPVVATLHNYRMTCSNAFLLRDGKHCELCVGKRTSTSGIVHRCFRGSHAGSAMIAASQLTYRRKAMPSIARWLMPAAGMRDVFERAGFPADRMFVHANAVEDPGPQAPNVDIEQPTMLFVGRLSEEKGVRQLLDAWGGQPPVEGGRLEIVGDGPLAAELATRTANRADIVLLGHLDAAAVGARMRSARTIVVPSTWPEVFGLVAVEAFANATPVVATDIGALSELVTEDVGWLARPGSNSALRGAIRESLADTTESNRRGAAARAHFEKYFTMDVRIAALERHYSEVLGIT